MANAARDAARQRHERAEAEAARLAAQTAELGGESDQQAGLLEARRAREAAEARLAGAADALARADSERQAAAAARDARRATRPGLGRTRRAEGGGEALTEALDRQSGDRRSTHALPRRL